MVSVFLICQSGKVAYNIMEFTMEFTDDCISSSIPGYVLYGTAGILLNINR